MEVEAVTHAFHWFAPRQSDHTCHHPHRFNELAATKSEMWNGKPSLECVNGRYPPPKTPVGVLPWTCRCDAKLPDRLVGKANIASGLHLGRSEVLRSLRHYMRAQNQGHHTIDHPEEKGVERGSARRSSWIFIVNQNEHLNLLKAKLAKIVTDGMERICAFLST